MLLNVNICQAHSIRAAEKCSAAVKQLIRIWEYRIRPALSDAECAALDFSIAAASIPNAVSAETKQNLHQYRDKGKIVKVPAVVALFGFLNRWNDSTGIPLEVSALDAANCYLACCGWTGGKHTGPTSASDEEKPPDQRSARPWRDVGFVSVQAALMGAYLANPQTLRVILPKEVQYLGLALATIGMSILIWALLNIGHSLTPFPTPKSSGKLVTTGIYRWARHPIYSGILMIALGLALFSQSGWRMLLFVALGVLFLAKSNYEEKLLIQRYPEYVKYRQHVGRFGPNIIGRIIQALRKISS
ncbi:MAG: isoprenylcysteine carboxylmethyltransferase family protein [Saprospiraceae bacterium]|nr:isoprenylcysteine carboxylmethyltransferase family protein [Saprospiraceae bacterium]MDW8482698.1 isoprenylcysteine carboxylmethyltransferase family protein [Saprospiraceae bacterium]